MILLAGCNAKPALRCAVDLRAAGHAPIRVECRADGAPPGPVVIKQMAQDAVAGVGDFTAVAVDGRSLPVREERDTAMGPNAKWFTSRLVEAGGAGALTYRYTITPGAWAGDELRGAKGYHFGYLDARGGLLSGRGLFLLPGWSSTLDTIDVSFELPDGWQVVGPAVSAGGRIRLRGAGRAAFDLVDGVLGFGPFEERRLGVPGTEVILWLSRNLPDALRADVARVAGSGLGFLAGRLGPLGHPLTVVLVNSPADDSMILAPTCGAGVGSDLGDIGPIQTHELLFAAARLWTACPGSPLRFDPQDVWLEESLAAYLTVGATDAAGIRPTAETWMLRARAARQAAVALTGPTPSSDPMAEQERRDKGAFLLADLDRKLRDSGGIARVVEVLRRQAPPKPLVDLVSDHLSGGAIEDFQSAVSSEAPLPDDVIRGITGVDPLPLSDDSSAAGSAAGGPRLRLLITSNTRGMLEVCGCVARQLGGIARRETVLHRIRTAGAPALFVDLGNAYASERGNPLLDSVGLREQALMLDLMTRQAYTAAAVGDTEMLRGPALFRDFTANAPLPYVNTNLRAEGRPIAAPWRIAAAGSIRVGFVSALDPGLYTEDHGRFYEKNASALEVADPVAAIAESARQARREGAGLVIAIGSLPPGLVRRILEEADDVDAILSTESTGAAHDGLLKFPGDDEQRLTGFAGDRLVFFSTGDGRWLEEIDLTLAGSGRIGGVRIVHHVLSEKVPDDPAFRSRLAQFYDAMKTDPAIAGSEAPVARVLPALLKAGYVGVGACRPCHASEWQSWEDTPHSSAFSTLLSRHRNYAPRCVGCHVTGYGAPGGYRLGDPGERLRHVQCEMCHGPGSLHAARPSRDNIIRRPPREACFECHTATQSAMTADNFETYERRIRHGG